MERIWKTPRLDKIDPHALRIDAENAVLSHLRRFDVMGADHAAKRIGEIVQDAVVWAQTGQGSPVGFESAYDLLTRSVIGVRVELPTDPDRLNPDFKGQLALLRLAHAARSAVLCHSALTYAQLAVLASLSARGVRDAMEIYKNKDGLIPNAEARAYLAAHEVKL